MRPIIGHAGLCTPHGHTHNPGTDAPAPEVGAAPAWSPETAAWGDFALALLGPGVRVKPLRYRGEDIDPEQRYPVSNPAKAAAYLRDGWALVAPLAHDLVPLDLDGCAVPMVLRFLDRLATRYGAHLAYRLSSGSPNSEHRAYAVPERLRWQFFREAMTATDYGVPVGPRWKIEDRWARERTGRRGKMLRLPGSAPLKQGGGVCWPLRADGTPVVDLPEATRMIVAARRAAGMPPVPLSAGPTGPETGEQDTPAPSSTRTGSAPLSAAASGPRRVGIGGEFTPSERAVLDTAPAKGSRSDAALTGLFIVTRRCGTDWTAAGPVVMSSRVFGKFTRRGEARARVWWDREAARHVEYLENRPRTERPEATPEQTDAVLQWLDAAYPRLWSRFPLARAARAYTAALFIGARRMLDGRGLEARPVAVRDLVQWGAAASPMTASRALADLEAAGVLSLSDGYDISAPLEARRWSVPGDLRGETDAGSGTCDSTQKTPPLSLTALRSLTAAAHDWMAPRLRAALRWLLAGPASTAALSEVLRVSVRSAQGLLSSLAGAGLVRADAAGVWSAVERAEAAASPEVTAAGERLEAARDRVAEDRAGWRDLWRSSVDAAGRLVWRFRPRRRPAAGRSAEAATCGDSASAASPSGTGPLSGVLRRRRGAGLLSSAVQAALPGLEAPPGGWSSVRWSAPPVVMRRSGVGRPRGGLSAPGAGECPDG